MRDILTGRGNTRGERETKGKGKVRIFDRMESGGEGEMESGGEGEMESGEEG